MDPWRVWKVAALPFLLVLLHAAVAPLAAAQSLTITRVVQQPSGAAAGVAQPISPGEDWYDQPLAVEGAARLRVVSSEPTVAAALLFDPDPLAPGGLVLRVVLFTNPDPLEFRQMQASRTIFAGQLIPARVVLASDGVSTQLAGETGRVTRIVVQDDHGSALRWSQSGELLVLEAIPPEAGGRPVGGTEPWYEGRPLTFLNYRLLAGGFAETDGSAGNAIGDLFVLDFLAARFNGFFTSDDTHYLGRVVLRTQAWRSEYAAAWVEGGGAFWQKLRSDNSVDEEDLTWVVGGTGVYRDGDWGGQAHVAFLDGPLVIELLGGWQMTRRIGLMLYWQSFDGSSGYGLGAGLDF